MVKFRRFIEFIKDKIISELGIDKMSKEFNTFSIIHLGFLMFYTLQLVFMNTLLRRFSDGNTTIFIYNMLFFSFIPVGMTLSVFSIKQKSSIFTMQSSIWLWIGILITTLSLIIIKQLHHFWILLAIVSSIANGCYWIAYYMSLTDYTDMKNRDIGLAIIWVCTGVANIIVPILGGYFIKLFSDFTGYIIMFSSAFLVAILCIIKSYKLVPDNHNKFDDPRVYIMESLRSIIFNKIWLYSSLIEFFRGIRDGVFIFLLNVLIFSVSSNESLVGINAFIAGIINVISNWLLGKLLYKDPKKDNRIKLLIIAVSSLLISSFLLLVNINITLLIIMTCINAFFSIYIQNISQSIFCMSIQLNPDAMKLRSESFVLKSYFLAIGRLLGILFFIFLPETNFYIVLGIVILNIVQIGTIITSKKTIDLVKDMCSLT